MKKWVQGLIAVFVLLTGSAVRTAAQETDVEKADVPRIRISLGANFLYTWWRPAWESTRVDKLLVLGNINPQINPTVIFGLTGTVQFNDSWGLSLVFTYGEFGLTVQEYFPIAVPIKPKFETKAQLFDVDVRAWYTLHPYVRFFAGARYRGQLAWFRYLERYTFRPHHGGLQAGFSCTLPIASTFYFEPEITGVIMGGREKDRPNAMAGCVASGSFVYRVPSSGLAVAVGGRYQYLAYISQSDPYQNNNDDRLYGITLSLLFGF
ncbi:MAG: hypothetical protein JW807_11770 [Spirochaetes bacterium]|nr:hypothetical protein [Spirochaetota bacterium]